MFGRYGKLSPPRLCQPLTHPHERGRGVAFGKVLCGEAAGLRCEAFMRRAVVPLWKHDAKKHKKTDFIQFARMFSASRARNAVPSPCFPKTTFPPSPASSCHSPPFSSHVVPSTFRAVFSLSRSVSPPFCKVLPLCRNILSPCHGNPCFCRDAPSF